MSVFISNRDMELEIVFANVGVRVGRRISPSQSTVQYPCTAFRVSTKVLLHFLARPSFDLRNEV